MFKEFLVPSKELSILQLLHKLDWYLQWYFFWFCDMFCRSSSGSRQWKRSWVVYELWAQWKRDWELLAMPPRQPSVPLSRCVTDCFLPLVFVHFCVHRGLNGPQQRFINCFKGYWRMLLFLQVLDAMGAEYEAQASGSFKYQKLVQFLQKRYAVMYLLTNSFYTEA